MVRCLKIAAFLALTVFGTTSTTTTGATTSGVVPTPTEAELERISHLLELAKAGKYPGTDRVRPGRRGAIPVWSQRTAMLYYNRNQAGEPLMWLTLAMGEFKNSKTVISDKKLWMKVWEEANPEQFARMKKVSGFISEEVTVDMGRVWQLNRQAAHHAGVSTRRKVGRERETAQAGERGLGQT